MTFDVFDVQQGGFHRPVLRTYCVAGLKRPKGEEISPRECITRQSVVGGGLSIHTRRLQGDGLTPLKFLVVLQQTAPARAIVFVGRLGRVKKSQCLLLSYHRLECSFHCLSFIETCFPVRKRAE